MQSCLFLYKYLFDFQEIKNGHDYSNARTLETQEKIMAQRIFALLLLFYTGNIFAQDSASSISQYGITWTFDKKYAYGQFVNGDYWVDGPIKIIAITPASVALTGQNNRIVNGSMLNPAINYLQGYDSRMLGTEGRSFDAALNAARPLGNDLSAENPLIISTPSSLLSSISREIPQDARNVITIAVLTILDTVPPPDAFRPPFTGSDNKTVTHTKTDIRRGVLPRLAVPSGVGATAQDVAAFFEKPWVEHMQDWQKEIFCPTANMHSYGREIASNVSDGALMLTLDVDSLEKEQLLLRMIQLGLDYYGMVLSPNGRITWTADGGHMCGRAFPLIFAGYILGDQAILDIMKKSGAYAYQNGYYAGNMPPDYIHFGEIDQTFFVSQRDVDGTHSSSWSPDPRDTVQLPYEAVDIGIADWGINHVISPKGDNKAWGAIYRAVNAPSWCGFVLASRILGIDSLWNHRPLFDYVNRWVAGGEEPGLTDLQKKMWFAYSDNYPISAAVISVKRAENRDKIMIHNHTGNLTMSIILEYSLSVSKHVNLGIYDLSGRLITTVVNERQPAGYHKVNFDAGKYRCSSGNFIYKAEIDSKSYTGTMVIVK